MVSFFHQTTAAMLIARLFASSPSFSSLLLSSLSSSTSSPAATSPANVAGHQLNCSATRQQLPEGAFLPYVYRRHRWRAMPHEAIRYANRPGAAGALLLPTPPMTPQDMPHAASTSSVLQMPGPALFFVQRVMRTQRALFAPRVRCPQFDVAHLVAPPAGVRRCQRRRYSGAFFSPFSHMPPSVQQRTMRAKRSAILIYSADSFVWLILRRFQPVPPPAADPPLSRLDFLSPPPSSFRH